MHIMQIISGEGFNGTVLHCLLLSRELARRGHRVTLVCLPDSAIAREVAAERGIEVVASDLHRWPTDELKRIAAIIHQRGVDVIHAHNSRAQFFGILLRWVAGVPSVATAHSRHFQLHWMFNDRVIAVSEASRQYQRRVNLVRAGRIETIHNFIDHRRFDQVPPDVRAEVRDSLGIDESTPLLGTIGDVIPRKGMTHFVDALPQIVEEVPQARLAVVGSIDETEYVEQVKSKARRLGVERAMIWTGHRRDVDRLITALDVFVLPSLEESFPLSILEAMAARLPVVATTVGGVGECVSDQRTGLLVPPADGASLAEAVLELLHDPSKRRQLGQAGRERVLKEFSVESQVREIENALARTAKLRKAA